jgi:hypothetical protein
MSNTITNRPLNNERFAVTGHTFITLGSRPTYRHDWTEWFSTREAAQHYLDTQASRSTPAFDMHPEKLHEIDAATAEQLREEEAGAILNG